MMKKLFFLLSIISLITLLSSCIKDDISDDLQGEWRLLGWEVDGVYHEVDSFKVEHHKFSVDFSGNYVKAYSLGNVTDFGKVRSKDNTLIKETVIQTQVLILDDESLFFDQYIGKIFRYENSGNKLKLYFTDNNYFLFTNQFTDKVKPSCNCEQDIIITVNNQQGTIHKDKYLRKWYIACEQYGNTDSVIRYYPQSFPDIDFLQENLKVIFSGDVYSMKVNWGDYQSEQTDGTYYYCFDLMKIEIQDK